MTMNPPYSIFPIAILSLALYLLSHVLVRLQIIKITAHRQAWNLLLLVTFLVTACLGLILAVKVNYKLKFQFADQLLVWHVDFGIGMAMIAIFHFLWHLNYYTKLLKTGWKMSDQAQIEKETTVFSGDKNQKIEFFQQIPVFALGMTAIITQVIILREFMSIFSGNELVIGTILANWMILTGLGAYLGKAAVRIIHSKRFVFYAMALSGFIPIVTVFLLNYLKNIIFPVGTMIGFYQVIIFSFILLIPFCLLSGFLFTFYANNLSQKYGANLISRAYSIEAAGSLAAGILYSFFLIYFFRSLQSLAIILTINLIIALIYSRDWNHRLPKIVLILAGLVAVSGVFVFHPDLRLKGFLFPNQQITYMKDTPYGSLVVTESAGQKNFYENNVLLFSTDNPIGSEEAAHFAMLQHPSPKKILLIGGGISGITREILKYPVERIDYVEINPWIIRVGKKYTQELNDQRIRTINKDARLFVRKTDERYDVIIIDMPSPGSAQVNRFFTLEFFRELKEKTTEGAVISLSLPSTENYVSEKAAQVQSVILQTLKKVFTNVSIIPGEKNYFIASDRLPDLNIASLTEARGITNVYVNKYYIDDQLLEQRSNTILQSLQATNQINMDFRPVAYLMETGYWMSHFRFNYWIIGAVALVLLSFSLARMNTVNLGLFTTGFTSSSIEILIIISFQIIYGYVYHITGIIITIFMAGLALGATSQEKIFKNTSLRNYRKLQFCVAIFSFILPWLILSLKTLQPPTSLVYLVFFLLTLTISVLAGAQFSLASRLHQDKIADISAGIYSVDLLGSAIGAFLVAVILFPLLGLVNVCIFLSVINVVAGFLILRKGRRLIYGSYKL
jgi:spermidine synthase